MSIRDTFRHVAELIVEFPEDDASEVNHPNKGAVKSDALDELDARLAEGQRHMEVLSGGTAAESMTPPDRNIAPRPASTLGNTSAAAKQLSGDTPQPDFNHIYSQANVPLSSFTAEQFLDMLNSLPPELPLEMRQKTMNVSLTAMGKAMGASPQTICSDATVKLKTLNTYTNDVASQTSEYLSLTEVEIAALQKQIADKVSAMDRIQNRRSAVTSACAAEATRLEGVLDFFGVTVNSQNSPPNP